MTIIDRQARVLLVTLNIKLSYTQLPKAAIHYNDSAQILMIDPLYSRQSTIQKPSLPNIVVKVTIVDSTPRLLDGELETGYNKRPKIGVVWQVI